MPSMESSSFLCPQEDDVILPSSSNLAINGEMES